MADWTGLLRGLLTVEEAERANECPSSPPTRLDTPVLWRPAPAGLKPNRMYTAEVIIEGSEPGESLHTIQFATSRYPTVRAHLTSGLTDAGLQLVRPGPRVPLVPLDWREGHEEKRTALEEARRALDEAITNDNQPRIAETIAQARKAFAELHASSSAAFTAIADAHDIANTALPPALEFVQIPVADSDRSILLMESPEPLDWARMVLSCRQAIAIGDLIHTDPLDPTGDPASPAGPVTDPADPIAALSLRIIWNNDQTRAFIFRDEGTGFAPGSFQSSISYYGDSHKELPLVSQGIDHEPVNETINLIVNLT
jgi:hypothetical protein